MEIQTATVNGGQLEIVLPSQPVSAASMERLRRLRQVRDSLEGRVVEGLKGELERRGAESLDGESPADLARAIGCLEPDWGRKFIAVKLALPHGKSLLADELQAAARALQREESRELERQKAAAARAAVRGVGNDE